MTTRDILCVSIGGSWESIETRLADGGWRVTSARELEAVRRIQARQRFPVSLMVVGRALSAPEAAVAECIQASDGSTWVAVSEPGALDAPGFRDLILGCFFDHQVMPVDWHELDLTLKRAIQRALLRRRHGASGGAPPVGTLGMVGQSPAVTRLRILVHKIAATNAPVLIGGESGSGKELAARAVHQCSDRASGPFVEVNCGAIAPSLIQSELFGHERGAFTGASSAKLGLIEAANGGTLFLDEIGDLPLELQANLLRFLQEKKISRVGAVSSVRVDVRVVAASHVDLAEAVALGRFREDLYYRLNVLPIDVPPLRQRMEDVPLLARHFLERCVSGRGARLDGFTQQAMAAMMAHAWPGNVRELYNRVQRAVVMAEQRLIGPSDLGLGVVGPAAGARLDVVRASAERDAIQEALLRFGRNITQAARELGISRMTLYRLMDKHGIESGND